MTGVDREKLNQVYDQIRVEYLSKQKVRYFVDKPHHMTTKALLRRMSFRGTYFRGALLLTPVADLYRIIVNRIMVFANECGLAEKPDTRSRLQEAIWTPVRNWFFVSGAVTYWWRMYSLWGTGSDFERRSGLYKGMCVLLPSRDKYPEIVQQFTNLLAKCIESVYV